MSFALPPFFSVGEGVVHYFHTGHIAPDCIYQERELRNIISQVSQAYGCKGFGFTYGSHYRVACFCCLSSEDMLHPALGFLPLIESFFMKSFVEVL